MELSCVIAKMTVIEIDSMLMKYPLKSYDFEGYFVAKLIAKSISCNSYVSAILGGW